MNYQQNKIVLFYRPELFDFDAQQNSSIQARLDNSFKMAEKHFGVPRYLDSSGLFIYCFILNKFWNKIYIQGISWRLSLAQLYCLSVPSST